jgi:hypothetical protein
MVASNKFFSTNYFSLNKTGYMVCVSIHWVLGMKYETPYDNVTNQGNSEAPDIGPYIVTFTGGTGVDPFRLKNGEQKMVNRTVIVQMCM